MEIAALDFAYCIEQLSRSKAAANLTSYAE